MLLLPVMFVDQIKIYAKAGDGGDGVVRWRHEKYKPKAGPAGGDGGRGGDVIIKAVDDINRLAKYTGDKDFVAENGEAGMGRSQDGKNGSSITIQVPVGSIVTDEKRSRAWEFTTAGQEEVVLIGGRGGVGNEHFKSSTNPTPQESTLGRAGEEAELSITLSLVVDVGLIGFPNAGKSTLLNTLTNANAKVGNYPFTTLSPHLGAFDSFVLADIPGLITGAADGKGLGHNFLRHITRTKMLLHLISLDSETVLGDYEAIRAELGKYGHDLVGKPEWVILTKSDLIDPKQVQKLVASFVEQGKTVFVISAETKQGLNELRTTLLSLLKANTPE